MQIYLRPAGVDPYVILADELGSTGTQDRISGYVPRLSKSPFIARNMFDGGAAIVQDIGNGLWTFNFRVDRVHADEQAALTFVANHAAQFNLNGNFDIEIVTGAISLYLAAAGLTEFTPDERSDASTIIRYGFTSGSYSGTPP